MLYRNRFGRIAGRRTCFKYEQIDTLIIAYRRQVRICEECNSAVNQEQQGGKRRRKHYVRYRFFEK